MSTDPIRLLQVDDIAFAQQVREIAGWNQMDADWERLIRFEPRGCFLVEWEGVPAGTASTTSHHGEVGWIGMVLVHPDFRRRGLATKLLEHCITYLKPRTRCIKLDATPAGMLVYEKLGFVEELRLHRWEGIVPAEGIAGDRILEGGNLPLALDRQAFGADRSAYLAALSDSSSVISDLNGRGYGMIREGIHAAYLGPVVAENSAVANATIASLLSRKAGEKIYWDILADNQPAVELAKRLGFVQQRELIRMSLGESGFEGDSKKHWAITGPETG